jgi:CIC family chloride channel protein
MPGHDATRASTTVGLPVDSSLGPALDSVRAPHRPPLADARVVAISALAILVGLVSGLAAQLLTRLIGLITNLAFYGRVSTAFVSPADNRLGLFVLLVPVAGGLLVGLMARFGSAAIRGHGIPEAMEQVLFNRSRIAPRLTLLKPVSAAISIGTGGPFGAEGPIIATGGALGSVVGQLLRITAEERKVLLAAGAAAGMAATFGSPVSAVLLAIELLLFEYRRRSVIPVSLASAAATGVRIAFAGSAPVFSIPGLTQPGGAALAFYCLLGAAVGVASVFVTRAVYVVEDLFERVPVPWMWWPALGGITVGVIGYFSPHTLGVGYDNIDAILSGNLLGRALFFLVALKFLSWCIALGSGTSGGTLAPLFTFGGGLGSLGGAGAAALLPSMGVDVKIAALVGMAGMFAGASNAFLASVVFAFETTRQPLGLLPLLGGCSAAFLVASLMMRHSIMTEKLARRGARVPSEYAADYLDQVLVGDSVSGRVVTLAGEDSLEGVRAWIASGADGSSHQGFPVLDPTGRLIGVLTRRDLLDPENDGSRTLRELIRRPPAVAFADSTLREAADHMVRENIGRLPVVRREAPLQVIGMLTRSDLLSAHGRRLEQERKIERGF